MSEMRVRRRSMQTAFIPAAILRSFSPLLLQHLLIMSLSRVREGTRINYAHILVPLLSFRHVRACLVTLVAASSHKEKIIHAFCFYVLVVR